MTSQFNLINTSLSIFLDTPSLDNYLLLSSNVSRGFGITMVPYAANQSYSSQESDRWQRLGSFFQSLELILRKTMVIDEEDFLLTQKEKLEGLKEPLLNLENLLRDWSKEPGNSAKAQAFWNSLEENRDLLDSLQANF